MIKVAKAIITKENKFLLIKRSSQSKFFPELWDFPGGKIEPVEEPVESVKREVLEEISLKIIPNRLESEFDYTENDSLIHFWVYSVKSFTGKVTLSSDHTQSLWLSKEEMKNYQLAPIVKLYFKFS